MKRGLEHLLFLHSDQLFLASLHKDHHCTCTIVVSQKTGDVLIQHEDGKTQGMDDGYVYTAVGRCESKLM